MLLSKLRSLIVLTKEAGQFWSNPFLFDYILLVPVALLNEWIVLPLNLDADKSSGPELGPLKCTEAISFDFPPLEHPTFISPLVF
jgi:hypothetical protein